MEKYGSIAISIYLIYQVIKCYQNETQEMKYNITGKEGESRIKEKQNDNLQRKHRRGERNADEKKENSSSLA